MKSAGILHELRINAAEVPAEFTPIDRYLDDYIADRLGISPNEVADYTILSKSVDGRAKPQVELVFRLAVTVESDFELMFDAEMPASPEELGIHFIGNSQLKPNLPHNPLVIGTGPAGLFAALLLAEYGCNPIILDRGKKVEDRKDDIDAIYQRRQVNPDSNFLFGEGGAGTYSDGKLYTRSKNPRSKAVIETFIAAGAPAEIRYLKRPHIGSDLLPGMVAGIRKRIEELGGVFHWSSQITGLQLTNGTCSGVQLANGESLEAPIVIVATGHSDRDLIKTITAAGVDYELKDFQIGSRIEHTQSFVNLMQYGIDPLPPCLGAAEYNVISRPPAKFKTENVTSFCMCPGGYIVPATSDKAQLSTNGMSNYQRDGQYANAGLIVRQHASKFRDADAAFTFLDELEKKASAAGRNNLSCPAQSAYGFAHGEVSLPRPDSSYKLGLIPTDLSTILPGPTVRAIKSALNFFERTHPGFMHSGNLVGLESRISSPVRFLRNPETLETSLDRLYIAGESAGYASGIMSAALDGIRIAESILTKN